MGVPLLELCQALSGYLGLPFVRFKFEACLVLGGGLVSFLQFLSDLTKLAVSFRVLRVCLDGIFQALIGRTEVAASPIELRYGQVFHEAFVIGLGACDFWEFTPACTDSFTALIDESRRIGVLWRC